MKDLGRENPLKSNDELSDSEQSEVEKENIQADIVEVERPPRARTKIYPDTIHISRITKSQ